MKVYKMTHWASLALRSHLLCLSSLVFCQAEDHPKEYEVDPFSFKRGEGGRWWSRC